jgi:glycosidase
MKKIIFLTTILLIFSSCGKNIDSEKIKINVKNAIIYEVNIRQYSEQGTFDDFTKDIPMLKELGVNIIWVMPIFPISKTKRKATGGDFAYLIEDKEKRDKMLGSYYAVSDYGKINPEFGTIDDFRNLVDTAHENGMYVILDWVPNHTGWDHEWITTNPEYYTQNENGEIIDPINPDSGESWGWADVADLNYDNKNMRSEMIDEMLYWIKDENIDGFRCDVASAVPLDFWEEAISKIRDEKDVFMLAEAEDPELVKGKRLFDMVYAWERHHIFNKMANEENAIEIWDKIMEKESERFESDDILMSFVTNHDENSWNGTIQERMGDASELLTALSYISPGMPLIYSGQEYDLDHRLLFFEKDEIPKTKKIMWPLLQKLGKLKKENPALHTGIDASNYKKINVANPEILAFERSKGTDSVIFLGNFSKNSQEMNNIFSGSFNYFDNVIENSEKLVFEPWGFKILTAAQKK